MKLFDNLTIAFPTKDRYKILNRALASLTPTIPPETPIMIMEDQPEKRYRNDNNQFLNYKNLSIIELPKKSSCAHLMNLCALLSGTRYIMICNDDITFCSDEWQKLVEKRVNEEALEYYLLFNHGAFIIDKCSLWKLGYFDERFKGGGFEDVDYLLRAAHGTLGKTGYFAPGGFLTYKLGLRHFNVRWIPPKKKVNIRHGNDTEILGIEHEQASINGACGWKIENNELHYNDKWFNKIYFGREMDKNFNFWPWNDFPQKFGDPDWYPALTNYWKNLK